MTFIKICRLILITLFFLAAGSGIALADIASETATSAAETVDPAQPSEAALPLVESTPVVTPAATTPSVSPPKPSAPVRANGIGSLINVFGGLLLILAIIFSLAWLLKRMGQGGGMMANNAIKIAASLPLGTRERIVLVDVGGKQLLLGMTPTSITTLHAFDEPVIDLNEAAEPSEFAKKLRGFLNTPKSTASTTETNQ